MKDPVLEFEIKQEKLLKEIDDKIIKTHKEKCYELCTDNQNPD